MKSLTIVIPSFNSMKWIDQCVRSVLAQEEENLKILSVDNESTDGTFEYLQKVKDSRFQLLSLPNIYPNGYREAVEYVFQNPQTDFITFVCSDDYISSEYAENILYTISKDPEIKCLQSPMISVNLSGQQQGMMKNSYSSWEDFKKQFLLRSPVNNPSVVYHKDLWPLIKDGRKAHAFNKVEDAGAGDYDLWGNFADNHVFIHPVEDFLGYFYRWHPGQASWAIRKNNINYDKMIQNYWRNKWKM